MIGYQCYDFNNLELQEVIYFCFFHEHRTDSLSKKCKKARVHLLYFYSTAMWTLNSLTLFNIRGGQCWQPLGFVAGSPWFTRIVQANRGLLLLLLLLLFDSLICYSSLWKFRIFYSSQVTQIVIYQHLN